MSITIPECKKEYYEEFFLSAMTQAEEEDILWFDSRPVNSIVQHIWYKQPTMRSETAFFIE